MSRSTQILAIPSGCKGYDSVVQVTQPRELTTMGENEQMVIAMKPSFNYVQIVPVLIHLEVCKQFAPTSTLIAFLSIEYT